MSPTFDALPLAGVHLGSAAKTNMIVTRQCSVMAFQCKLSCSLRTFPIGAELVYICHINPAIFENAALS
jgi:hypothetical protein